MKKIILGFYLLLGFTSVNGQVYPLVEDFNSMSPFTSPSGGWLSSVAGFQIYPNHGNASQGMTKQLSTFQPTDSVTSPLIGPITAASSLSFDYRAVLVSLYPSSAFTFTATDKIEIKVLNGSITTTILTIDQSNHVSTTSFATKQIGLGAFAGSNIKVIIKVTRSSATTLFDNFYDFDNFKVQSSSNIIENSGLSANAVLYPNPIKQGDLLQVKDFTPGTYNVNLINLQGKVLSEGSKAIPQKNRSVINTENLSPGIYFVTMQNDLHSYVLKFIVQ